MRHLRKREPLLLGVAFLVGVLLTGWHAWTTGAFAPDQSTVKRRIRSIEVKREPLREPRLRGQSTARSMTPPTSTRTQETPIEVEDGLTVLLRTGSRDHPAPVANGTVAVIRRGGDEERIRATVFTKDVVLTRRAGDDGRVVLDPSLLPERGLVVGMGADLRARLVALPEDRHGEVTLHLEETPLLMGTVLTPDGLPVEDALVVAGEPGTEILGDDCRILDEASGRRATRTDESGEFRLRGLAPGASVVCTARRDGYAFVGVEVDGRRTRFPSVKVEQRSLVLRMKPLLYGCFRAKNSRTRARMADQLRALRGRGGVQIDRYQPDYFLATGEADPFTPNDPSLVQWTMAGIGERAVQLYVQFAGYEPALVTVTACPLDQFLARRDEQVAYFQETRAVATGSLGVHLEGSPMVAEGQPILCVRLEEFAPEGDLFAGWATVKGRRVRVERAVPSRYVQGILQADGSYLFPNVPAGQRTMRVYWGGTMASDAEYELQANDTLSLAVTPPPFTGAVLDFRDADGERLYGVQYTLDPAAIGERATVLRTRLETRADGTIAPPRPHALAPGLWRVQAYAPGLGGGRAEFEVEESKVTHVEVTLAGP